MQFVKGDFDFLSLSLHIHYPGKMLIIESIKIHIELSVSNFILCDVHLTS